MFPFGGRMRAEFARRRFPPPPPPIRRNRSDVALVVANVDTGGRGRGRGRVVVPPRIGGMTSTSNYAAPSASFLPRPPGRSYARSSHSSPSGVDVDVGIDVVRRLEEEEEVEGTTMTPSTPTTPCPECRPSVSLRYERGGSVAIVTMSNPGRMNALTSDMMDRLDDIVNDLAVWSGDDDGDGGDGTWRTSSKSSSSSSSSSSSHSSYPAMGSSANVHARAVILTGGNGTFCAGLDLRGDESTCADGGGGGSDVPVPKNENIVDGDGMTRKMTYITNRLLALPVPVIVAIDGHAVGGGAELSTCADLVVLSRDATVRFVHARRGASTGWGGTRRLVGRVGRNRAMRMLLLGECVRGIDEANNITTIEVGSSSSTTTTRDDDIRGNARCRGGGMTTMSSSTYADAVADVNETALEATMRLVIDPLCDLPCSKSIRAIKRAISASDGDWDLFVHRGTTAREYEYDEYEHDDDHHSIYRGGGRMLNFDNVAIRGEMDSFLSVWGGTMNERLIRKARDRLRGEGGGGQGREDRSFELDQRPSTD
ncbi:hypothetical protein ACHAXA_000528 [Cyclostephanos tholiformis]|uniref:Naphthoate synthase n=1 Tax=Cyclostephanos tholiformis TaxID=382380 RepID=A0ABD3STB4_9STRA